MIVFEPLASPGTAFGELRLTGFGRRDVRGAFGYLDFDVRGSARAQGSARGDLVLDGQGFHSTVGGRAIGFLGLEGAGAGRVAGVAEGWLVFDRAAFVPELVPTGRGDFGFDLSGSGGYRRTQINSPIDFLGFDGRAHSAALGGVGRGELVFESATNPTLDPEAVHAFLAFGTYVAAVMGVDEDGVMDGVLLDQSARIDVSTFLQQRLRAQAGLQSSAESTVALNDTVELSETVLLTYRLLIAEGFLAGGTVTELRDAVERTMDGLLLTGVVDSEAEAFSLLTLGVLLGARSDALIRETLLGTVRLGDALADQVAQVVAALSRLRAQDTVQSTAVLSVLIHESFSVSDSVASSAELVAAITEALRFGLRLSLDTGDYTAWVLNTESQHLSSYTQFPVNSFAELGGKLYGACDDGIYLLEGDDDAGEPIAARLRFALTTLGTGVQKRMVSAYLGYTASNDLLLQVIHTDDTGGKRAHTYRMRAAPAVAPVNGRVTFGRGVKSAYYAFELQNVDGGMFDVDTLRVYPLALDRRITRS